LLTSAAALLRIDVLKRELDSLRPLNAQTVQALNEWHRVELTYSSNAIEGNTLTRSETAVEAHSRLVEIHPFSDGNGRTARLLMNAVLWRGGYPPAIVEPADRAAYVDTLEQRHDGDREPHRAFMLNCVLASAERYLSVVRRA
jgi:Fic family protein